MVCDNICRVVERQARDLEVRGSNPGPGSNFSLELEFELFNNMYEQNVFAFISLSIFCPVLSTEDALVIC